MTNIVPAPPINSSNVIAYEMALVEFNRFADEMDLDVDESSMNEDDLDSFGKHKRKLLKSLCNGSLVINENGEAVYTPKKGDCGPLTFHEKDGASLMSMDGKKKNQSMHQTFAVMGALTKNHPNLFAKMKGVDLNVCMSIFLLLMG